MATAIYLQPRLHGRQVRVQMVMGWCSLMTQASGQYVAISRGKALVDQRRSQATHQAGRANRIAHGVVQAVASG